MGRLFKIRADHDPGSGYNHRDGILAIPLQPRDTVLVDARLHTIGVGNGSPDGRRENKERPSDVA